MPNWSMKPGSKEKNTESNFSEKTYNKVKSFIKGTPGARKPGTVKK